MCGIAGIISRAPDRNTESVVRAMVDCVAYRGPNGRHTISSSEAAFGHARLSIIDLDTRSDQPFWSEDRSRCIVFNGEIYNYIELRDELRALGCRFRTEGDTEVILAAYDTWGNECWHRFNGMWAVAIWDVNARTVVLSRDRFGVKPMYYAVNSSGGLVFGSELKQVVTGLGTVPEPNWTEVYRMLDRAPFATNGTVFSNILRLPPGHRLTFNAATGAQEEVRWYALTPERDPARYRDPVSEFRRLFVDAVRLRLRSDVPVGICLSGGVDSSAIACVMARELGVTPRTFSSVYAEAAYSEERFIDDVIAHIGADAMKITPRAEDFTDVMEKIVMHHDEPIQMPGTYSQWHVMQLAGPHVRVLLDGQGGDETVGGYYSFFPAYARSLAFDILRFRHPAERWNAFREAVFGQSRIGGSSRGLLRAMLPSLRRNASTSWKDRVCVDAFRRKMNGAEAAGAKTVLPELPDELAREMYRQFTDTNLPMLLTYEDRLSMAFSIESRVPFLDYRLVEYCFGLPYHYKMKGLTTKWILREAFKDILPESVYRRQDKKGFPTPLAVWMRGPVGEAMRSRIAHALRSGSELSNVFDASAVSALFDAHTRGENHERLLFRVFTTVLWYESWFKT